MKNWKLTFADGTKQWQMGTSSYHAVRTWLQQHAHLGKTINWVYSVQAENGVMIHERRWR